jgi:site-specific DNA recombinase
MVRAIPAPRNRRRKGSAAPGAVGMAAIYIRVSVDEQIESGNGGSLESQEAACRAECAKRELEVVAVFRDNGFSGGTLQRPGLNELRATVKAGKVAAVVVYAVDRLSRRQADTLALLEEFKHYGAGLWSASQDFETATGTGKAMVGFLAIFAELQREEIRSRTKRALQMKMARGEAVGRTPFGVKIELRHGRKRYAPAETWPIVRDILDQRQGGASCQKIADGLNAAGVLTPTGHRIKAGGKVGRGPVRGAGKWSAATVAGLCSSRAVLAVYQGSAVESSP